MVRLPCVRPLSRLNGATPTRAAICFRLSFPSSETAYSDRLGHPFRWYPATCSDHPVTHSAGTLPGSERSDGCLAPFLWQQQGERSDDHPLSSVVFSPSPFLFLIDGPFSDNTCALWTRRSQIASATVGSTSISCQVFVGTWLLTTVERWS